MNIWIDLVNSPHVLFFEPIINEIRRREHVVILTARNYAQTVDLAKHLSIECKCIGAHGGKSLLRKIRNLISRSIKLIKYIRKRRIDLAVSLNSPSQAIAAKILGIPVVIIMDYEFQPLNHLTFRLADKVLVPKAFPKSALKRYGARFSKVTKFEGFKEQVYLSDFTPDPCFLNSLDIDTDKVLVTVRPPATMALYHRFENTLFTDLLHNISQNEKVEAIVLPRTPSQKKVIQEKGFKNIRIPDEPLDGKNLMYHSDLVISAGGTMNREAAILGTPAYSLFKGKIPSVDKKLVEMGRMKCIQKSEDLELIKLMKENSISCLADKTLCKEIVTQTIEVL